MSRRVTRQSLRFPLLGINLTAPRTEQDPNTCINCSNVRIFDALEGRARGGIRPGLSKYSSARIDGANRVQAIDYVIVIADSNPATGSLGVRTVKPMVIANGTIGGFTTSSATAATSSGSRSILNTSPFVLTTELQGKVYCTDGISYRVWTGSDNTVDDWTASSGSLPGTDGTKVPRLIEMWRGRIVMSGLRDDSHNWFMSELGNPDNWNTAPDNPTEIQAIAGGVGVVGKLPDKVNCIIPFSDDYCIFGCDHSIWVMSGDPQAGGSIDLISDTIGMAFGRPWCRDAFGAVYFMSSRGNICILPGPNKAPESLSKDSIQPELKDIDLNTSFVRMVWDESQYGVYTFITPFSAASTSHWFWDYRTKGWFRDKFANNDHNPFAVKLFDGDEPADRVILTGSENGYVMKIDDTVSNDDGTAIESFVIIGPLNDKENGNEIILSQLQGILDENSDTVKYEVMVGDTAEEAVNSEAGTFNGDGTFGAGRSQVVNPRERGYYCYIKIGNTSSTSSWAFDKINARIVVIESGKGRQRNDS